MTRRSALARALLDRPNDRSLHTVPVPRIGGIGILAGLGAHWYAAPALPAALQAALLAYLVLAALSWIDDRYGLSPLVRLPAHLAVSAFWLAWLGLPVALAAALTLVIAWSANLYNFMDGADGLAGSMAVGGFGAYGWLALAAGDLGLAALAAAIALSALAFLFFNWPRASLFLGDSGSVPLGFLAAAIGVYGWHKQLWAWHLPVVVFFPFVFDATYTLARRMIAGKPPWQAHREHLYQQLVLTGLGHRGLLARELPVMAICAVLGVSTSSRPDIGAFILAALIGVALCLARRIARIERPPEAKEQ